MADTRTPEALRQEIAAERQQLVRAVDELRAETTDVKRRVGSKAKVVVPVALAGVVLMATGLTATLRFIGRRVRR